MKPTVNRATHALLRRVEQAVRPAAVLQIPNSQLAILPNATHMVPYDDPATFNAVVERFLQAAFVKKDRIGDTMKSLEKMRTPPATK